MNNWKLKSGLLLLCVVVIMVSVWWALAQRPPTQGPASVPADLASTDYETESGLAEALPNERSSVDDAADKQASSGPDSNQPVSPRPFDPDRARLEALQATSATQLQELAAQARMAGDESLAREFELMENEVCGIVTRADFGISTPIVRDGEGMRRWESFCAGSEPPADPEEASQHMRERIAHLLPLRDTMQSRFETLHETMEPGDALFSMLSEADSPDELKAIGLLISSGHIDRDLIPELTLADEGVGETYAVTPGLALEIYGCKRFGHCGPDHASTIGLCMAVAGCQPGDDSLDLIAWLVSPQQLAMAMMIVDMIEDHEVSPRP